MQAKTWGMGVMLVVGLLTGCGGSGMEEGLSSEEVAGQAVSRCEGGCNARYNFCIVRATQPPEVCRAELIACLEECALNPLELAPASQAR
ncbi:hypothetical protein JY651_23240 [Pyxidicoccus parkwayensis]|uniref:Lipoprotein n=1 Tax=Pyxidicoccus parkwayensis TaxID=2813578 RepID=A0ABX7PB82_9BACT|nr:hypothetical protein [Pyxidicoccus parkwaysis]QSQ27645.1 hypothetical protein JY651_23240 [Pyxidicoccus parkwaysis]